MPIFAFADMTNLLGLRKTQAGPRGKNSVKGAATTGGTARLLYANMRPCHIAGATAAARRNGAGHKKPVHGGPYRAGSRSRQSTDGSAFKWHSQALIRPVRCAVTGRPHMGQSVGKAAK